MGVEDQLNQTLDSNVEGNLSQSDLEGISSGAEFYQIYNAIKMSPGDVVLEQDIVDGLNGGVRSCTPQSGNSPALLTLDYWNGKNVLGRVSTILTSFRETTPSLASIADRVGYQLLAGVLLAGGRISKEEYCGLGLAINSKLTSGIDE